MLRVVVTSELQFLYIVYVYAPFKSQAPIPAMPIWYLLISKLDSNELTRGRMKASGKDTRELGRKRQWVPQRSRANLQSERQHLGWSLKMSAASLSTLWYLGYGVQEKIFHSSLRTWKWSCLLGVMLRAVQSLILIQTTCIYISRNRRHISYSKFFELTV